MDFNEYKEKRLKESATLKAEYDSLATEYEELIALKQYNLSKENLENSEEI